MEFWWFYPQEGTAVATSEPDDGVNWLPLTTADVHRLEGSTDQESVPVQANGLHILFSLNPHEMTMEPLYWRGSKLPVRKARWLRLSGADNTEETKGGQPLSVEWEEAIEAAWQESLPWITAAATEETNAAILERVVEIKGHSDWLLLVRRGSLSSASLLPRSLVEAHLGHHHAEQKEITEVTMASAANKPFWSGLLSPNRNHRPYRLIRGYQAYYEAMLQGRHEGLVLPKPQASRVREEKPPKHLLFLVHGIGQKWAGRWGYSAIKDAQQLRELVAPTVEVIPILWRTELESSSCGFFAEDHPTLNFDEMLASITLDTVPAIRTLASDVSLDVLLYMTPRHFCRIVDRVRSEMIRCWRLFCQAHPGAQEHTRVSIIGHSLGSALVTDLLSGSGDTRDEIQASLAQVPQQLGFTPHIFFSLGSPLALFLLLKHHKLAGCREFCQDDEALGSLLETHPADGPRLLFLACHQLYNVFLPHDPVAYRLEPLLIPPSQMSSYAKPVLLPYGKAGLTRFKMDLEESIGSLRNSLIASLPNWLIKNSKSTDLPDSTASPPKWTPLRRLNRRNRMDYVAQESILEHAYISAISSHFTYCSDSDIASFILHELE